jgi:hypothetical protein
MRARVREAERDRHPADARRGAHYRAACLALRCRSAGCQEINPETCAGCRADMLLKGGGESGGGRRGLVAVSVPRFGPMPQGVRQASTRRLGGIPLVSDRLTEGIPLVSNRLTEGIPLVSDRLTEGIPLVSDRLTEGIPLVSDRLTEGIPLVSHWRMGGYPTGVRRVSGKKKAGAEAPAFITDRLATGWLSCHRRRRSAAAQPGRSSS